MDWYDHLVLLPLFVSGEVGVLTYYWKKVENSSWLEIPYGGPGYFLQSPSHIFHFSSVVSSGRSCSGALIMRAVPFWIAMRLWVCVWNAKPYSFSKCRLAMTILLVPSWPISRILVTFLQV